VDILLVTFFLVILVALLDTVATNLLWWPLFFRFGIPLFKRSFQLSKLYQPVKLKQTINKSLNKFRFETAEEIFILPQIGFIASFRTFSTEIRAMAVVTREGQVNVVGRLSIGATLRSILILLVSLVFAVNGIWMGLLAGTILIMSFAYRYFMIANQIEAILNELKEVINEQPSSVEAFSNSILNS
jgi:hypothetical protein